MNKTFKYALGLVLTLGAMTSAIAQDNFPDVPENHWAFEALARMKQNGLLVGYPDGLFRGPRPATRYEMAVAIHATYMHLKNITENLQTQIDELKKRPTGGGPADDHTAINAALTSLRNDVNGMKGWGDDIANLKRMASTFEKELASMGVDMEAMKKDMASLNDRVTKLEKNALPITIHGDANLLMMAGGSTSNRFGIGVDGQIFGANGPNAVGMENDFSVFHEAHFKIAGTNETGPKWWAVMSIGNLLGSPTYGSMSQTAAGMNHNDEGNTDIVFDRFAVEFDTSLIGQGFNAKVGRLGYKISPYLYQRPDTTPYYKNEHWDNKEWTMDGGIFGFNFGSAKLNAFVGRNDGRRSTGGIDINPMMVGRVGPQFVVGGPRPTGLAGGVVQVDQTLGFNLNVPLGEKGGLDLAYLLHGSRQTALNRAHVFGGELNWDFGMVKFNAGYAQSNVFAGNTSVVTKQNAAWHAGFGYEAEKWGLNVGFREIQPRFASAGDWGRIGMWWNPSDIKGFNAKAHFDVSENMSLWASGQWYSGLGKAGASGMGTADKVNSLKVGLDYKVNESWNAMLGFENVEWNLGTLGALNGKPKERWYNIGLGYGMSENAKLSLLWQISDYDGKATPGFAGRFTGNLLTTQLSIKF